MAWKVITEPALEPLTLLEVKNHLQIDDFSDDDALIISLIVAVRQDVEAYLNRKLIETEVKEYYSCFVNDARFGKSLRLSLSPILSVDSIQYIDENKDTQTLDSDLYQVDLVNLPYHVFEMNEQSFPTVLAGVVNPIVVTYKAGFGTTAESVPSAIRHGMLLMIRDLYDNRENPVREKRNTAAKNLLSKYRVKYH